MLMLYSSENLEVCEPIFIVFIGGRVGGGTCGKYPTCIFTNTSIGTEHVYMLQILYIDFTVFSRATNITIH